MNRPRPCPACGKAVDSGKKFCPKCGHALTAPAAIPLGPPPVAAPAPTATLVVPCPSCARPVDPNRKFCNSCGKALIFPAAIPLPQPAVSATAVARPARRPARARAPSPPRRLAAWMIVAGVLGVVLLAGVTGGAIWLLKGRHAPQEENGDDGSSGANGAGEPRMVARYEGPPGSGTRIDVPEGALKETVHLNVNIVPVARRTFARDMQPLAIVRLEPDGTQFDKPVRVTFQLQQPAQPGEKLPILTRKGKDWERTGVVAQVTADGRHAEAWVTHFCENAAASAPFDANFINKLHKISLVGLAKTNTALDLVIEKGSLTPDDLKTIYGTETSEAIEVYDTMAGWLDRANPPFHTFLLMVRLAEKPAGEDYKTFLGPLWDFVKDEYFTADGTKKKTEDWGVPEVDLTGEFKTIFEPALKIALRKKYGSSDPQELLKKKGTELYDELLLRYFKQRQAEQSKPRLPDDRSGFVFDGPNNTIYHRPQKNVTLRKIVLPDDAASKVAYHTACAAELEKALVTLLIDWENGKYPDIESYHLEDLAAELLSEREFVCNGDPQVTRAYERLTKLLKAVQADLVEKYAHPTAEGLTDYQWAAYKFPVKAFLGPRQLFDERKPAATFGVGMPRSPLDALTYFTVPLPGEEVPSSSTDYRLVLDSRPGDVAPESIQFFVTEYQKDKSYYDRSAESPLAVIKVEHGARRQVQLRIQYRPERFQVSEQGGKAHFRLEVDKPGPVGFFQDGDSVGIHARFTMDPSGSCADAGDQEAPGSMAYRGSRGNSMERKFASSELTADGWPKESVLWSIYHTTRSDKTGQGWLKSKEAEWRRPSVYEQAGVAADPKVKKRIEASPTELIQYVVMTDDKGKVRYTTMSSFVVYREFLIGFERYSATTGDFKAERDAVLTRTKALIDKRFPK